MTVNVIR